MFNVQGDNKMNKKTFVTVLAISTFISVSSMSSNVRPMLLYKKGIIRNDLI